MNEEQINRLGTSNAQRNIVSINFDATRKELVRKGVFTEKEAFRVESCFRKHLYLLYLYPSGTALAPPDQIGEFWHTYILHTSRYRSETRNIFGEYLDHDFDPDPGTPEYTEAVRAWLELFEMHFGKAPDWFIFTEGGIKE